VRGKTFHCCRDLLLFTFYFLPPSGRPFCPLVRSVTTGRWIMGDGLTVVMGRVSAEEGRRKEDKGQGTHAESTQ
jgi:hypothetical protein